MTIISHYRNLVFDVESKRRLIAKKLAKIVIEIAGITVYLRHLAYGEGAVPLQIVAATSDFDGLNGKTC